MSENLKTLSILQYNVQKSYSVIAELLRDLEVHKYDIIAVQEPYINNLTTPLSTHNPVKDQFNTYLPQHKQP
jgi:hypothetical protein